MVVVTVVLDVVLLVVVAIVIFDFSGVKIKNFKIRPTVTTRIVNTMQDMIMVLTHR